MIAVIGASGQLGRDLCEIIGPANAVALNHQAVELTSAESLERALRPLAPSVVVNTAAFNHVDDAELRPWDCFSVNSLGVRELARVCQTMKATLVHFSTDYVFGLDTQRARPYEETDSPGPLGVYGLSKLAGEYFVRTICPHHYLIRSCGLFGRHGQGGKGRNFVNTMLRLGRERGEVRVVNDQTCTPTFTRDLAEATVRLLTSDSFGTYHWTNAGSCTWYQFACEIFEQTRLPVRCDPITSDQFGARAIRPKYSVLSTLKYQSLGFPSPRRWQDALAEYLATSSPSGRGGVP